MLQHQQLPSPSTPETVLRHPLVGALALAAPMAAPSGARHLPIFRAAGALLRQDRNMRQW